MMMYHVSHRFGQYDVDPPVESLEALYSELELQDDEHPDVSVEHESGWSLAAFPGGLLVWENVEGRTPRHMTAVPKEKTLDLWRHLAAGDIPAIDSEPWHDGYG